MNKRIASYDIIGTATEEGSNAVIINVFFDSTKNKYLFISEALDVFWSMYPAQLLNTEAEEVWFKLFRGGWYAIKIKEGLWDLRFSKS